MVESRRELAVPTVRPMLETDVPEVLEAEAEAYDFPWSDGVFRDCLRVGYACRVMRQGRAVVGYCIMSAAAGESHILNLCIRPRCQGQGFGQLLLQRMCSLAFARGARSTLLEVRPSNPVAIRLYVGQGFNQVGTRRAYYPSDTGREDALVYALDLTKVEWFDRDAN